MGSTYPLPNFPKSSLYPPTDRMHESVQQIDTGDIGDFVSSEISRAPFRPAIRQFSMNGMTYWQSWANLEYPPEYRLNVTKGAITDTARISVLNNPAEPISNAPIAIQDYAISTKMVWSGGGEI